jgi:hypothetical protein
MEFLGFLQPPLDGYFEGFWKKLSDRLTFLDTPDNLSISSKHLEKRITMTTYQEIKKKVGGTKRGRKPLDTAERERRAELRKTENKRKIEAKRRAWFVLQHKYSDEFTKVYEEELATLKKEKKFQTK